MGPFGVSLAGVGHHHEQHHDETEAGQRRSRREQVSQRQRLVVEADPGHAHQPYERVVAATSARVVVLRTRRTRIHLVAEYRGMVVVAEYRGYVGVAEYRGMV